MASLIGREMVRRRVRRTVDVNKSVANRVLEGMMDWVAALVPDCTLVERYGFRCSVNGGRSIGAWGWAAAQERVKGEEKGARKGGE